MKAKTTRRALLLSAMALLLCVSMLVGTTFAWFTDSVTSGVNMIAAGNLDVELKYAKVANGTLSTWNSVGGAEDLFNPNALWEPGHVEVVYLEVSNQGSLELKYQLGVHVAEETPATNVDGKAFKLSDHLVFKVEKMDDPSDTYTDRQAVAAAAGTALGLKDYNGETTRLEVGGTDYVALIVYMPETVGNEANYRGTRPEIKLGVELFATQQVAEKDSFGSNYDETAGLPWDGETKEDPEVDENGVIHITNAAELVAMMDVTGNSIYSGKTIVLDADINLGGRTVKGIGSDVTNFAGIFDGQGHTISNFKIDASGRSYYAGLFNQVSHGGTVKNLTVANATVVGTSMVGAVASSVDGGAAIENCKAINCTLFGVKKVGAVVGYSLGSSVTNNYAENCTVYYSEKDASEILGYENTGSTVSGNTFNNVIVRESPKTVTYNGSGIQNALDSLNSGDTLILPAGTYITTGTFAVPHGVTIAGNPNGGTVIHQDSAAQDDIFNCAGDATIKYIRFETNRKGYAVADNTQEHQTAGNITLIGCYFKGIAAEKNWGVYKNLNGNLTIRDCTFENYNNAVCGVNNQGGSQTVITGCTFINCNEEAIGYVTSSVAADFEEKAIQDNQGLTADNVIGY